jgi:hypothetical protein
MSDERKAISLGFIGAPPMTLKLEQEGIDKLVAAIQAGEQWVEVADEKRNVTLRADLVVSYSLDPDEREERRAGF